MGMTMELQLVTPWGRLAANRSAGGIVYTHSDVPDYQLMYMSIVNLFLNLQKNSLFVFAGLASCPTNEFYTNVAQLW